MSKSSKALLDKFTPRIVLELANRIRTGKSVADELNITQTHLSRVLKAQGMERIPGQTLKARVANSRLAQTRIEHRSKVAIKLKAGKITMEEACIEASCHARTMWRYVAKA